MALRTDIQTFPNLSYRAFQHPLDATATAILEKTPLLPTLIGAYSKTILELQQKIGYMSSCLRVSADQYPSLYKQYLKMAEVIAVPKLPKLFIQTSPEINAYAIGIHDFSIVIYSGLIDILTEDELLAIIGHELGHVKCQHMLYSTLAQLIKNFGADRLIETLLPAGAGLLASYTIQLAILEWYRKAEFSCDRAALIATQNKDSVVSALAKLAGYAKNLPQTEFNIEAVYVQAGDFEDIGASSILEKAAKVLLLMKETHPYPIVRVQELNKWSNTFVYQGILDGVIPDIPILRGATISIPELSLPVEEEIDE